MLDTHATSRSTARDIAALVGFGAATALAAWLASTATTGASDSEWFFSLDKPAFYPPEAAFGIVWSVLYVMIAVAGWLAWRSGGGTTVVGPWAIQLVLNMSWSILFFGLQEPGWALAEILVLLGAATWTTVILARFSRWAAALFVPYLGWIAFATLLNGSIVWLN
jgi:translocator protein